jgi:serine/threonine-protein kinase RsbW/stage II sporulation protein AB (anti-sigma F factor)
MTSGSTDRIDVRVPARPEHVSALRKAAQAFAAERGLPDPAAVGLAVSEAATNAVLHAYTDGGEGEIRLVCCSFDDRLVVVVRDWGTGMRPRPDSPGLGLGLPTIATLCGGFDVEAADGVGTLLRMQFPMRSARAA